MTAVEVAMADPDDRMNIADQNLKIWLGFLPEECEATVGKLAKRLIFFPGWLATSCYRQKTMSSLFLSDCHPALGGRLCGKSSLFPKHKRTLLVGKGPTLRLYAPGVNNAC